MVSTYAQTYPSGQRVERGALAIPGARERVVLRLAGEDELAEIASRLQVPVDVVREAVRAEARGLLANLEATAERRYELRLAELADGGLRKRRAWQDRPLERSISDWAESKRGRGRSAKHALEFGRIVRSASAAMGWRTVRSLDAERAAAYLASLTSHSARTRAKIRGALVNFGKWLEGAGRVRANPFAGLEHAAATEADRVLERRSLTEAEVAILFAWLDAAAGPGGAMAPAARAAVYQLAVELGLRRGEVAALEASDFALPAEGWGRLYVRAGTTKAKRGAELPLRPELVARLRPLVRGSGRVLQVPAQTARMLRADMSDARAWWIGRAGDEDERRQRERSEVLLSTDRRGRVVDFHALRSTAATRLVRAGVDPALTQRIMRHKSYATTARHYVRADAGDLEAALSRVSPESAADCAGGGATWAP